MINIKTNLLLNTLIKFSYYIQTSILIKTLTSIIIFKFIGISTHNLISNPTKILLSILINILTGIMISTN